MRKELFKPLKYEEMPLGKLYYRPVIETKYDKVIRSIKTFIENYG